MAVKTMKIQFRMGKEADLKAEKLLIGEPAYATDSQKIGIKTADGEILWFATLNGAGKLNQMPTSDDVGAIAKTLLGVKNGVPILNSDGKVIQDPATAYLPLPETDDNSTHQHWAKYADGTMHQWGYVTDTISVTTVVGSMYMLSPYTFTLPQQFTAKESVDGSVVSNGLLIAINTTGIGSGSQLLFRIVSPIPVSNLAITLMYDAWGRWK